MTNRAERARRTAAAMALLWLGACAEQGGASMDADPASGDIPMAGVGGFVPTAGFDGHAGTAGAPGWDDDAVAGNGWDDDDLDDDFGGVGGVAGTVAPQPPDDQDPSAPPPTGTCCSDGDCLCHGPDPGGLTSSSGPYQTDSFNGSTGKIHYPTNAEPPFAGVAICGGFLNTGPEMDAWGSFYASHGIVTVVTTTLGSDVPQIRAQKLLASIQELKTQNTTSGSPLFGQMSDRYGVSGYSMGGGGTTLAASEDPSLRSAVPLAPWGGNGSSVSVPMLLLCGTTDSTAPCSMSQSVYGALPAATPKMMISINGVGHFSWFNPTSAGSGTSGSYALAFQKVYLEGDDRWLPLLTTNPSGATMTTNIQ